MKKPLDSQMSQGGFLCLGTLAFMSLFFRVSGTKAQGSGLGLRCGRRHSFEGIYERTPPMPYNIHYKVDDRRLGVVHLYLL